LHSLRLADAIYEPLEHAASSAVVFVTFTFYDRHWQVLASLSLHQYNLAVDARFDPMHRYFLQLFKAFFCRDLASVYWHSHDLG